MKFLRRIGLFSCLLFIGVLGGLMAPLPSEALTVTIDGIPVAISTTSTACSSGYNLCSFIAPGRYADWVVGDVATSNKARIMIGDNSTASSLDLLKMTGITFTPFAPGGTQTAIVVVTHTYSAGGGNPQGAYSWGYGMAGHFDPPGGPTPAAENVVGNRLKQIGVGNFAGTGNVTLGLGIDTGVLASPSTNNLNGSISKTRAAAVVLANCNTGSARCAPTITQTFTITVVGADKLVMTDSLIGAGATCRPVDSGAIPIPPHIYAYMLQLDPAAPNDVNQVSAWLAEMADMYAHKPLKKKLLLFVKSLVDKWIAKTIPGTCPEVLEDQNAVILADVDMEEDNCLNTPEGCAIAEPAPGEIVIKVEAITNVLGSWGFDAEGLGMSDFTLVGVHAGNTDTAGTKTFSGIAAGESGGSRTIKQISFPVPHDNDGDSVWFLKGVNCLNLLGPTQSQWAPLVIDETLVGVTVSELESTETLTCFFHNHHTHNGQEENIMPHPDGGGADVPVIP